MKKLILLYFFASAGILINAEELVDYPRLQQFYTPYEMVKIEPINEGFYLIPLEERTPFDRVWNYNFPELPLYVRYYVGPNPIRAYDSHNILATSDHTLPAGEAIPYNDEHAFIIPHGFEGFATDFWLFEYKGKRYVCGVCVMQGGASGAPGVILIFDITDTAKVKFATFESFILERNYLERDYPEIGVYGDKLCILKTDWMMDTEKYKIHPPGRSHWSRLYSIEEEGIAEVFDENGRNIELFFNWNKWDGMSGILEKHIPEQPVLYTRKTGDIIPFERGIEDRSRLFQELDMRTARAIRERIARNPENLDMETVQLLLDMDRDRDMDVENNDTAETREEPVLSEIGSVSPGTPQQPQGIDEAEAAFKVSGTTKGLPRILTGIGVLLFITGLVLLIMRRKNCTKLLRD
jgi:hypothetical protein